MTCIVGLKTPQGVYIGGDSASTDDSGSQTILTSAKVFALRQQETRMLLGCTTSYRMLQLLRYELRLPPCELGMEAEASLVTAFIPAVRACLKAGGFAKTEDEREEGGCFLLAFQGRLFEVESDYQVSEPLSGYAAVGSGAACALGALYATPHLAPERRLELALEAAAFHNAYVKPPYRISFLSVENEEIRSQGGKQDTPNE